jgi:hypothetical protein
MTAWLRSGNRAFLSLVAMSHLLGVRAIVFSMSCWSSTAIVVRHGLWNSVAKRSCWHPHPAMRSASGRSSLLYTLEKSDNWNVLKAYFDIPLRGEKGHSKNLRWLDRLNELRRIVAHPHKRSFKSEDLDFLEWVRKAFEQKLLTADESLTAHLAH